MQKGIEHFVTNICECLKKKKLNKETRAPMMPIHTTYPFEMVSIDLRHLDKCKHRYEYILVVLDHFTRFAQAYATRNKTAKTVPDKIFIDYALKFGFPSRLHHNMGKESENNLLARLKDLSGIHGQHNTLPPTREWAGRAPGKSSMHNCTWNEATGYSPYYLLFRWSLRLPVDLLSQPSCFFFQFSLCIYRQGVAIPDQGQSVYIKIHKQIHKQTRNKQTKKKWKEGV